MKYHKEIKREIESLVGVNLNPKTVCYWEPSSKALMRLKRVREFKMANELTQDDLKKQKEAVSLLTKAKDFLEMGCVEQIKAREYRVKPIKGYNKTTHIVYINPSGQKVCDCQGWNTKVRNGDKGSCSHCLAVSQFIYLNNYQIGVDKAR